MTNYKPIPISQPPEKEGWYTCIDEDGYHCQNYWHNIDKKWLGYRSKIMVSYLLPVADSIILTREEIEAVWDAAENWVDLGGLAPYPSKQTFINNLLTGK